jgi:hypothetical protein
LLRLEPDEAKVSRPVLRGGSGSNAAPLPDHFFSEISIGWGAMRQHFQFARGFYLSNFFLTILRPFNIGFYETLALFCLRWVVSTSGYYVRT